MKELNKEIIKQYALDFSKLFGLDLEEQMKKEGPRPLGEYFFSKGVFGVYSLAEADKLPEAIITFKDIIDESVKNLRVRADDLLELSVELKAIHEIYDYCKHHSEVMMDQYVEMYKDYWLFEGEDIKKGLGDLWILPRMESALSKGLFDTYLYHMKNGEVPAEDSVFKLNPNLYIVDSINSFLRFSKIADTEDVQVTWILKIEDILDYSYFCAVIQFKGNVWIGTDKTMFANPNNKYHSRNPTRRREEHFDYLDLPYILLDEMNEIRKKVKLPVIEGSKLEFHVYPLKDLHIGHRAFIHQLSYKIISQLQVDLPKISSYEDVMLALPSSEDVRSQSSFSSDEYKGVNERVEEIRKIVAETSNELAIVNKDIILKSEHYDPEWLATPDSLQNLNNWIANKEVSEEVQNKLDELYPLGSWGSLGSERDTIDKRHNEFEEILRPHVQNVFPYLFAGSEGSLIVFENKNVAQFSSRSSELCTFTGGSGYGAPSIRDPEGDMTYNGYRGTCKFCEKHPESNVLSITFRSAKHLQVFFGMKWKDIPKWFRLYRYHGFEPYHGNSILDNVNPLAMIKDNVSKRYANGFSIDIHMCGWCRRRFLKEHQKIEGTALIKVDYDTMKVKSIEKYDKDKGGYFSTKI